MFMMFEFMFPIIFVMVFGMIIFQFATRIGTWHKNNQSPRLSVNATIVAKRESITHHSHANALSLIHIGHLDAEFTENDGHRSGNRV